MFVRGCWRRIKTKFTYMVLSEKGRFENEGRIWLRGVLDDSDLQRLEKYCPINGVPGIRLNGDSHFQKLMNCCGEIHTKIDALLPKSKMVRAVVFDKSIGINWGVPWHQDRVIAVKEKHEIPGYGLWTNKSGMWHVEPPVDILKEMIFIRVHFDDTDENNGCLELALGSHKYGRIKERDIGGILSKSVTEFCTAKRGDVLIVKALTLHRSLKSKTTDSRRALRVDYCNAKLQAPLEWAFAI